MREELVRLLNTVSNPFLQDRVDSAWDAVPVDVEAINRTAFDRCLETIRVVRETRQSRGLVLHGEPGSGKTHLLQRLRRWVQKHVEGWFIYVPPFAHPDRFFRHLLECLMKDVLRSEGQEGLSQIEVAVGQQLMGQPGVSLHEVAAWWQRIQADHPPGEGLFTYLQGPLEELVFRLELDPEVITVLRHYLARFHRFEAYTWLLGRAIREEDMNRIGACRTLDDEDRAKQAISTFSRLAGHSFSIVLAFDQLEGLQIDPSDQYGLRVFANGVVNLFMECRNLAALTCVQTHFLPPLKEAVRTGPYDRLAQEESALTLLKLDTAMQLVTRRLEASEDLQQIRIMLGEQDPFWPLEHARIEGLVPPAGLSPRRLLRGCRELFEEKRAARAYPQLPTPPSPPPDPFREHWEAVFEEELQRPQPKLDEGVYADGLLKILDVARPVGARGKRSRIRDVDLLLERGPDRIGVSICHAEHMTSLAARLRRLIQVVERGQLPRLLLIRDQRLPLSPTARVTQAHLRSLQEAGHRMIRPPAEAYAALAAARRLLADAAAGDLTVDNRTVPPEELKSWLAQHLPTPLQDFLEEVVGDQIEQEDMLERLQELLKGRWILQAADAAAELGLAEEQVSSLVGRFPQVVGYLAGPPALVFLHPEGVERV